MTGRFGLCALVAAAFGLAGIAHAAPMAASGSSTQQEISLISGLYKTEDYKVDGEDGGSKSTIEMGARYGQPLMSRYAWFGEGRLCSKSYKGGKGKSPDNSTCIRVGGGARVFFPKFSESVQPFLAAAASYESEKEADVSGDGYRQTDTSGLFYRGIAGMRFELDRGFFLELELDAFKSALFATEKTTTQTATTKSDSETSRKELYFQTYGAMNQTAVSLGMKF